MNLRNKIFYPRYFSKVLLSSLTIGSFVFAEQLTIESAASKWISHFSGAPHQDIGKKNFHATQILDIISREGHSLPSYMKNDLTTLGFDFSKELVAQNRPVLDNALFIDSGIFRFHYTTTGENAVSLLDSDQNTIPDYVELIKQTFDDISIIDFDSLNYTQPPGDGWYFNQDNGGSGHYDVYIWNLDDPYYTLYGYVQGENYAQNFSDLTRGDNENSTNVEEVNAVISYMCLRNNYLNFPGVESDIVKVTSAHEFYHAIQYGYDAWEAGWIKEATAVWMEEIHYNDINDCYQYLSEYFQYPERGPNYDTDRGYGAYIYIHYLVNNHFSVEFPKSFWENSIIHDSFDDDYDITTIMETMSQYEPDFTSYVFNDNQFEKLTNDFHIANALFTNDSIYDSIYHHDEVSNQDWPVFAPYYEEEIYLSGADTESITDKSIGTFGANYYKLNVSDSTLENISITLLPSNTDEGVLYMSIIQNTAIEVTNMHELELNVSTLDQFILLISAFSYTVNELMYSIDISKNYSDSLNVSSSELFPSELMLGRNFPNPFNSSTTISFSVPQTGEISINIFNIRGQLVRILKTNVQHPGTHALRWNSTRENGKEVESGVYLYSLIMNGKKVGSNKMLYIK